MRYGSCRQWGGAPGRVANPGVFGDTPNRLPSAGISCERPAWTRFGDSGTDESPRSSKAIVAGDRGENCPNNGGDESRIGSIGSATELS